ncbi:MAG: patatin-like phospholipase family protein [Treponemataceae bacterium]|nr:patatin-like phospholipase family protein [Treponemataceae bacterium]
MRKITRCVALVLSLFFAVSLTAQETAARPKIAVVLSGGGAKGFAHIALLEALEEEGIPIDLITGTSMGSMIGALYASGYSAKEIRQIISSTDMMSMMLDQAAASSPLPPEAFDLSRGNLVSYPVSSEGVGAAPGLLGDEKILTFMGRLLAKNYDIESFDQLPIPYRAVGTDVLTFTPYIFESGSLLKAVRGSMSLPMLFTPAPTGTGRYVMDGGLVNNLPVRLARELGADIIIACDVASNLPDTTAGLSTASDMGIHLFNFFITPNATAQHEDADLLITPDLHPYNTLSFMFPTEIVDLGEAAVAQCRSELHAIALQLAEAGVPLQPADPDRISIYAAKPEPVVESVRIEDVAATAPVPLPDPATYSWITGRPLTASVLDRLTTQVTRDRTKYNLASLSFETHAGSTPEACTLVLVANHYDQNPGLLTIGGVPSLNATIGNGRVDGVVFPDLNFRLHLDQPFSHDYFGGIGSTITAGFELSPQLFHLGDATLHANTGASIKNGGISPDTGYSWLNKPLLDDTAASAFLGLEIRILRFSTVRTGFQYTLNNTVSGLVHEPAGYAKAVINSLHDPASSWSGFRLDAEGFYGTVSGVRFRQLQLFNLMPETSSLGYEFALGSKRGPVVLTDSYCDYGGIDGMCGYAAGTMVRDFALAGIRYQHHLFNVLGMPGLFQLQLKAGTSNPETLSAADAGYGAYLLLNSPIGNITAGVSHSVTNKKICIILGIR